MLPCALASRQHSKFISGKPVRRLLQTNGASGSRLSSSTTRNGFGDFRTMLMHTNWCKTGKNCISHGHSWKLAYLLRTFEGATAMSILGWWRLAGTPLPAEIRNCRDTKLWYTESSSLDISHIESEAAWNRNPQRWKFPLRSWEPCESSASKLGLGS